MMVVSIRRVVLPVKSEWRSRARRAQQRTTGSPLWQPILILTMGGPFAGRISQHSLRTVAGPVRRPRLLRDDSSSVGQGIQDPQVEHGGGAFHPDGVRGPAVPQG